MGSILNREIRYLRGVGEQRAKRFSHLEIYTVGDLLSHYPVKYIDLTAAYMPENAPQEQICPIIATVFSKGHTYRIRKGLEITKMIAGSNQFTFTVTFFNSKYTAGSLKEGSDYIFYGKLSSSLTGFQMSSPQIFSTEDSGNLIPQYPLTQGLSNNIISAAVKNALSLLDDNEADIIPLQLRQKYSLQEYHDALRSIHFPCSQECAEEAKRRLIFEEFLLLSFSLMLTRSSTDKQKALPMEPVSLSPFYDSLDFIPTKAQFRSIDECCSDMNGEHPMNRLIQGDVGCGKTLVAAACTYISCKNGYQTAVMAPTEILAEQHFNTFSSLLSPFGFSVALLTGSMSRKEKSEVKALLASGDIDICIGTHALLTPDVHFNNLGLVITDEQHRFGVRQRAALAGSVNNVNVLVMSATPIPRTLSLIIYGELDVSVIDEMPAGRIPVKTYSVSTELRARALMFLQKHIKEGKQGYIVCSLVEESEYLGEKVVSASEYYEDIKKMFPDTRSALLHGKMKGSEKEKIMREFKDGSIDLLVSTTVIEVGVDVPNAVIMIIENAERFGLSQLHQLRGRVGRGSDESYCILISDSKNEDSRYRLEKMCETSDGFEIAQADLALRGPGDFFGHRQHGLPQLKIADMSGDVKLLSDAQNAASELIRSYELEPDKFYPPLLEAAEKLIYASGVRPN